MRSGVRLALDWGKARVGVAACDKGAILSFPVETVTLFEGKAAAAASSRPIEVTGAEFVRALSRVAELVGEYEPIEVLLGLPVALSGREEVAASSMRTVADAVAARLAPTPVRLIDERLSSAAAHRHLSNAGKSNKNRRGIIDQAAAVAILDHALSSEKSTGTAPGELVAPDSTSIPTYDDVRNQL